MSRPSPVDPGRIADGGARPAIVEPGRGDIGYGELDELASRVAARLAAAGIGRGDRVGIHLRRSTDAVACVSVVGDGLTEDGGVLRDVLSVARAEGCAPRSVSSTPFRITLAVARASADPLTRALHGRFCEG